MTVPAAVRIIGRTIGTGVFGLRRVLMIVIRMAVIVMITSEKPIAVEMRLSVVSFALAGRHFPMRVRNRRPLIGDKSHDHKCIKETSQHTVNYYSVDCCLQR